MKDRNTLQVPEGATGQTPLASPFVDKKAFGKRWQGSPRWVDSLLAQGLPHLKIGKRRVRIFVVEADAWMQQTFRVQRRGGAR